MSEYQVQAYSRPGHRRNDDYHFIDYATNICLVADGMGKKGTGLQAAHHAVHTAHLQLAYLKELADKKEMKPSEIEEKIRKTFELANEVLLAIPERVQSYKGWGTTLDVLVPIMDRIYFGHVGDGRIYGYGAGNWSRLAGDGVLPHGNAKQVFEAELESLMRPLDNHMGMEC